MQAILKPPWPDLVYSRLCSDDNGNGDGDGGGGGGGSGGGSGDGAGDGKGKAGDGDGGGGKDGDGDGDKRGKDGLLADAGKKAGDGDGGGEGDDDAAKAAAAAAAAAAGKPTLLSMDERPDWLPENYYDTENKGVHLQSLVKAERDMRGKLAEINKGKPQAPANASDYKFEFDGASVKDAKGEVITKDGKPYAVDTTDPIVAAFAEAAHAEGLPQTTFQTIADKVYRTLISFTHDKYEFYDPAVELAKLGEGGKPLMEGIHTWLGGLQSRGTISQAEFNEAMELGKYASGIRFLNKMRTLTGEQPIPISGPTVDGAEQHSDEELYAMVGTEKYQTDPAEQERVRKLFIARWGEQPGGASPAGLGVHTPKVTNKPVKSAR